MKRVKFHLICLFLLFSCSESDTSLNTDDVLLSVSEEFINANNLKGVSIAVSSPVYKWVEGVGISTEGVAIQPEMQFAIASITKNLVATLILRLEEEGLLNINDPANNYLGTNTSIDQAITIEHLLSHKSGLQDYVNSSGFIEGLFLEPDRIYTPQEILEFVGEPAMGPGEGFDYSNTNFILLGLIIEATTESSFMEALRDYVFAPEGIPEFYLPTEVEVSGETVNYWSAILGNGLEDISSISKNSVYSSAWTAGGLWTDARTLNRYTQSLFRGSILSESSLAKMVEFNGIDNTTTVELNGYGLGTMRFLTNREWTGHTGDIFGFGSITAYSRQDDISITALFNQELSEQKKIEFVDLLFQTVSSFNN